MYRLLGLLVVATACGDNRIVAHDVGGDAPVPACVTTLAEVSAYPGTASGTVLGGGADLTVDDGACASEVADLYFAPRGEDVVVHLTNLVPGTKYGVALVTAEDLAFYVTADCPPATGAVNDCLLFSDVSLENESGVFTATGAEAWVVVDTAADPAPPMRGTFTLTVAEAQCKASTDCTSAALPICDANFQCVAGAQQCTSDDVHDSGAGDDGPAAATPIAMPTAGTPTVIDAAVCDVPASERDWFRIELTGDVGIDLTFAGANNDLDLFLVDAHGQTVTSSQKDRGNAEGIAATGLASGTYYLVVLQFEQNPANAVAVPYRLTVSVPDCATSYDCTAAHPVCSAAKVCGAGSVLCAGDDAGDAGPGDDGPLGGRDLAAGPYAADICTTSLVEADYYTFTVTAGLGAAVTLAWTDLTADLDAYITDATGKLMGASLYRNPEVVTLTYLPAGTYYVRVVEYTGGNPSTLVTPYTITGTVTAAQSCATAADCAAEFATQLYRGACNGTTHACERLPASGTGAVNTACDADADCASGVCSYIDFESHAQRSVCSATCAVAMDCTTIVGTQCDPTFGVCVPGCVLDTDCGANTSSATPDVGEPWNYEVCTVATSSCGP